MARSGEREIAERFAERYRAAEADLAREIELAVIGGAWGANGYTSRAQADVLARVLELGRGVRLLDLGAGCGWPGLYLATSTGCQAVLADVLVEGLVPAMTRATREQLSGRAAAVAASARHPPFQPAVFDAIVHTDVLCCLRPKLSVLRACHRLLRPGGRTAFFTIHPAAGLSPAHRRRASRDGPVAVATSRPYREMLESAGFTTVCEMDRTEEFAAVARAWIEQWDRHHSGLHPLLARINYHIQEGIRAKYRRLRPYKAMKRAWNRITTQTPGLLPHWRWETGQGTSQPHGESKRSLVTGDCHTRICGSPGVKFPGPPDHYQGLSKVPSS